MNRSSFKINDPFEDMKNRRGKLTDTQDEKTKLLWLAKRLADVAEEMNPIDDDQKKMVRKGSMLGLIVSLISKFGFMAGSMLMWR